MENRIESLISRMTLEEKISMLAGVDFWCTGGGSARVKPYYTVTPLDGIKSLCGSSVEIVYESGCFINQRTPAFNPDYFSTDGVESESGLTAHFFTSSDLTGKPFRVEVDSELSPMWISSEDPMSCRWTGKFTAPDSGVYTFGVITDDFARVYIGNELIIDEKSVVTEFMTDEKPVEAIGEFNASAGETYPVVIEYLVNPKRRGILRRFRLGCEFPAPADLMERAVKAARVADVAVVFVGTSEEWETEHFDREDIVSSD